MKLILPIEVADDLEPHLPADTKFVRVDIDGNLDGDATDAEVYFNWLYYLKPTTLHKVLESAPQLRWHHAPNAGVNNMLTPKYLERDIILTNGAGVHAIPIAEFVITYMLSYAKQLPSLYKLQTQQRWQRGFQIEELQDKTLLIIGAGGIGQEIATRAKAFGMRIFGSRRHPQALRNFDKVVGANDWKALLSEANYVVIATPLTKETKGMIDAEALRLMRPDAYLMNIARGAIVDEPALLKALQEGWIEKCSFRYGVYRTATARKPVLDVTECFYYTTLFWSFSQSQRAIACTVSRQFDTLPSRKTPPQYRG